MIRSHRGINNDIYSQYESDLLSSHRNVILFNRDKSPIASHSLTDVLKYATAVVSTLSTAILDSIYMRIPTAIFNDANDFFPYLPCIRTAEDLQIFIDAPPLNQYEFVSGIYGDLDANLQSAAKEIVWFWESNNRILIR